METPNETHKTPSVQQQWDDLALPYKSKFQLKGGKDLYLKQPTKEQHRFLAHLSADNFQNVIEEMQNNYRTAFSHLKELKEKWKGVAEKLNIVGDIRSFRQELNHLKGLGNFAFLESDLSEMETKINILFKQNYKIKHAVVEKAEQMKSDPADYHTEDWHDLIKEWKNGPLIEKKDNDNLWQRIEDARNSFYRNKREYVAEKEKQQMQNLDFKMQVCEDAEKWAVSVDWRTATKALKELFERWQNIGYVPSHVKNEALWQRFQKARDTFYNRKAQHYEQIQKEQEKNYQAKLSLIEEANRIKNNTNWRQTAAAFRELMDKWRQIGRVPREKSEETWQQFQAARDVFYSARRAHREKRNQQLNENLKQKEQLIEQAKNIQNDTNWKETTQQMNHLMVKWKKVGSVPREKNDEIWQHFLSARKHFFARKDADRERRKAKFWHHLNKRIEQTQNFLKKLKGEQDEDKGRLADFTTALKKTTGTSSKDNELRTHLKNLIQELNKTIPNRENKIKSAEQQLEELNKKHDDAAQREKEKAERITENKEQNTKKKSDKTLEENNTDHPNSQ